MRALLMHVLPLHVLLMGVVLMGVVLLGALMGVLLMGALRLRHAGAAAHHPQPRKRATLSLRLVALPPPYDPGVSHPVGRWRDRLAPNTVY